ncbi:phosphoribosylanthranilate isomerase [Salinimicrobium catena]|nr:phosphoribosylanthranilate isomerase [Salinimicrobium catena]
MREPENIQQVSLLRPDYFGLIFYEGSPRFVSEDIGNPGQEIKKVGVFVNASEEYILEKVKKFGLSAVQLHGGESADFCSRLKKDAGIFPQIIKVFSIKEAFDFQLLKDFEEHVDLFLFDTKGRQHGGNGIAFNWKVLKDYSSTTPFFLSGGIGPDEVPAIKNLYKYFQNEGKQNVFYGVDVNSRFENAPGLKNADKLRNFKKELFSVEQK